MSKLGSWSRWGWHSASSRCWNGTGQRATLAVAERARAAGAGRAPCGLDIRRRWSKQWREDGRPLPPAGSPNVLLIVLDTLRADQLSVYGYQRAPRPRWMAWPRGGFASIVPVHPHPGRSPRTPASSPAAGPMSLACNGWSRLTGNFPTLAEYLGTHGYATAGFVSNAGYCSYDTGLDRGFTHFEDYVLERLGSLRTAGLLDAAVKSFGHLTLPFDHGWFHQFEPL